MAENYLDKAVAVVPSKQQLEWMDLEFCAFIHFGVNTFTGREWGTGYEEPDVFNPTAFSAEQWAKTVKLAGMKGLILTCKHHDGFCLWPSEYTDHSVKSSSWRDGKGDVVKDVADACRLYGIKFGIYLSPWDMHEPSYGKGREYDVYYMNQLRELLTNYGDIFCVWLDGACGEGKNGKKQVYDWQSYYKLIRELQPNAVISINGPDVRWCGNEAGVCRVSEWSVVPAFYNENGYKGGKAPKKPVNFTEPDIGSRRKIKKCDEFIWYPAEVDVSIRKGWFYTKNDDYTVKPLSKLLKIYNNSVGSNASLLLNIPPQPDGLINEKDVETLATMGAVLSLHYEDNLALDSSMSGSCFLDELHSPTRALPDKVGYWRSSADPKNAELILDMGDEYDVDRIVLKENVETGQQIEKFALYEEKNGKWKKLYNGTVIGHKKICELDCAHRTRRLKLVIMKTRKFATIKSFEVY